jgi:hypothetical protein
LKVAGETMSGILVAERKVLRDAIGIGGIHYCGLAQTSAALRTFALQQMAAARLHPHNLAGSGYLKPLGDGLFRFDAFRTTHKFAFSEKSAQYRDRAWGKQAVIYNATGAPARHNVDAHNVGGDTG